MTSVVGQQAAAAPAAYSVSATVTYNRITAACEITFKIKGDPNTSYFLAAAVGATNQNLDLYGYSGPNASPTTNSRGTATVTAAAVMPVGTWRDAAVAVWMAQDNSGYTGNAIASAVARNRC